MSADNWAQCPRCLKRRAQEIENKQAQVEGSYGQVSVQRFDAMRTELETLKADRMDNNFREDYEIYGAEDGVVTVSYKGACSICKLSLKFKHEHPMDEL